LPSALPGGHSSEAETSTVAGTTHTLPLSTAYYKAEVPIWLDLVSEPAGWADTFLSSEAREVLDVLGGVVVVFSLGHPGSATAAGRNGDEQSRELVRHVGRVVKEGLGGWEWDGVGLAVGVGDVDLAGDEGGEKVLDSWEDVCAEFGLEFVHVSGSGGKAEGGRNEFGEKTGIFRVLEALESNDWAQADGLGEDDDEDEEDGDRSGEGESRRAATNPEVSTRAELDDPPDLDPESLEFGFDREDFVGLRQAIWSGDREEDGEEGTVDDVQKLEGMMRKLLAVRDMSAGLPEEQRKRMAKKAVGEVMKEL